MYIICVCVTEFYIHVYNHVPSVYVCACKYIYIYAYISLEHGWFLNIAIIVLPLHCVLRIGTVDLSRPGLMWPDASRGLVQK